MKLIFLIIPIVTILISCDTILDSKTTTESTLNSSEISTSNTFEGKYELNTDAWISYLFFQDDGFVYVHLAGFFSFTNTKFDEANRFELPLRNFYKYEKQGSKIYINLGEYGYYGLDCSNPNELLEFYNPFDSDKEYKWIKKDNCPPY